MAEVKFAEGAAAATPSASTVTIYAKADGLMYSKDDAGTETAMSGTTDHGALSGLADDDHTQYALLAGRSGGQVLRGGTASGDDITIRSTSNATKGDIFIADEGGNVIIGGGATASELRILEASGSGTNYSAFKCQAQAANVTYTLPADDGDADQVLSTNGTGTLDWVTSASGSPGGSDTQVQFNDASAFGGDAGLTYNKTTDALTIAGQLIISGAAAGQIVFPATQNASTNANTLDDYEEGTWTPVLGGEGGTSGQAYGNQLGYYRKVGQLVVASYIAELSTEGTITGNCQIKGLPFTSLTITGSENIGIAFCNYFSLATNWVGVNTLVESNATAATLRGAQAAASTSNTALTATDIANNSGVRGTIVYFAAA